MFRASLAHLQEALHKRSFGLGLCAGVDVGCSRDEEITAHIYIRKVIRIACLVRVVFKVQLHRGRNTLGLGQG
jgi:hypothetical protein